MQSKKKNIYSNYISNSLLMAMPISFYDIFWLFFIWELFCNEISDKMFKIFIMTEKYSSHEICI